MVSKIVSPFCSYGHHRCYFIKYVCNLCINHYWLVALCTCFINIIRIKVDIFVGKHSECDVSLAATSPRHGRAGKKRQNPFASSNKGKKLHLDSDVVEPKTDPETSSLFSVLDKAEQVSK